MSMIDRYLHLNDVLQKGKVVILFGPRQVGKSTLIKGFLKSSEKKYLLANGDDTSVHERLSEVKLKNILLFAEGKELIVIDEAQKVPNIGQVLKLLVDERPDLQILVSGSSSFELAGQLGEPLTGRKKTFRLFPIAMQELKLSLSPNELNQNLEEYLILGMYPELFNTPLRKEKEAYLHELVDSYLLKDILELEKVKSSKLIRDMLRLLAFQIGNEVSLHELGRNLGIDYKTVDRYLDILQKSFIIFSVGGFSRNLRKEITKMSKYYFYDNGVRNALINNFNALNLRNDIGQLWENFIFMERLKYRHYHGIGANEFFWRTYDQKEIDLIEERDGKLFGFEFKWKSDNVKAPKDWLQAYPEGSFEVINKENYLDFVT